MALKVKPTTADLTVAKVMAKHASPMQEELVSILTVAADERVLLSLAALAWLQSRRSSSTIRTRYNHLLIVASASSVLPHILKMLFSQTRPDRLTVRGHLHGIPVSGRAEDAFPSGHALHMGALASFAGSLPGKSRRVIEALAVGLSLSRIVLLAHWTSDVIVGFALGSMLERSLRWLSGYGEIAPKIHRERTENE
jgi:undecaprenyl-diphosphatase